MSIVTKISKALVPTLALLFSKGLERDSVLAQDLIPNQTQEYSEPPGIISSVLESAKYQARYISIAVPTFSVFDIPGLQKANISLGELNFVKRIRLVFPDATGHQAAAAFHMLLREKKPINDLIIYKTNFPGLSLHETGLLIQANIPLEQLNQFKDNAGYKLTHSEIAKLLILGYSPDQANELIEKKKEITEKANDTSGFSWIKILTYDPNIPVSDEAFIPDVDYKDFTGGNAKAFVSNSNRRLTIPPNLYEIVGRWSYRDYESCPSYNQRDFEQFITDQLKLNKFPKEAIATMEPYDAIFFAAKLAMRMEYIDVDDDDQFYFDDLVKLLNKGVGECERYEGAFLAFAYYFKSLNPKLQNFYFVKGPNVGGIMPGHTWPAIIVVNGDPDSDQNSNYRRVLVSHIDPTFAACGYPLQAKEDAHFSMSSIKMILWYP